MDVDFEKTKLCCLCSLDSVPEITGDVEFTSPKVELHPDLLDVLKTRGLKTALLNIRSLPKKIDELRLFLRRCRDIGILPLNETWLNDQLPSDEVAIPGLNLFRRDRSSSRKGGGVAIYISDKIQAVRRCDLEDMVLENLWLELMFPNSKGILFGTCYRPPDDSQFLEIFKLGLERVSGEDKETLLTGDFNYDLKALTQGADLQALKSVFRLHNFLQLIDCPTRVTKLSATLIDLIVTNNPRNIVKQGEVPFSLSDHDLVLCVRKINAMKYAPKIIECQDYRNNSLEEFCESLSQINWDPVRHASDVNNAFDLFNDIFKEQCDRHAPLIKKKVRGVNYPWLTNEIKKLMQQRDCFLKKARPTNKEIDWSAYRRSRNATNDKVRSAKANYNRNLIQENDDSKSSWRAVKRVLPNDKKLKLSMSSIKVDGNLKTDKNAIAEGFNHFFTSIVKTISDKLSQRSSKISCQRPQSPLQNTEATFTNENFEPSLVRPNVVYNLLRKLKVNKATGLDNIPARLLKDGASVISECLTHIINLSFSSGVVPDDSKTSRVVPLFKSGNREEMDNYRLIPILPVISKNRRESRISSIV